MTRFPRWPLIKFLSERKSFISGTAEYCQFFLLKKNESCIRMRKFHPLFCFGHLMFTQTDLIFWTARRKRCNFSEMWRVHTTRYSVIFQKISSRVRVVQKNSSSIRVAGTRWALHLKHWFRQTTFSWMSLLISKPMLEVIHSYEFWIIWPDGVQQQGDPAAGFSQQSRVGN